ncbi:MAG: hypothetical protein GY838_13200 [bacterium]|nr:hypothetical protein [bacterium]
MPAEIKSPSLSVRSNLKRSFKARCSELGHSMADVLIGLIDGWLLGVYQVPSPDASSPETIYVPPRAYRLLRDALRAAGQHRQMRGVLEALIVGWVEGRFVWPPPKSDHEDR